MEANRKIIYSAIGIIFAGLIGLNINTKIENSKTSDQLQKELILNDQLQSDVNFAFREKRGHLKEIEQLKAESATLLESNNLIKEKIRKVESQLKEKITASNKQLKKIKGLKSEIQQLKSGEGKNTARIAELNKEIEKLNQNVQKLTAQRNELESRLNAMPRGKASLFRADAYKKGKQSLRHLTVSARRTKNIDVNFVCPNDLIGKDEKVYLTLTHLDSNKKVDNKIKPLTIQLDASPKEILPVAIKNIGGNTAKNQVSINFKLNQRLKKGTYQLDLFTANDYLGGTQIKLK